jgi:hypothetical protein
MEYDQVLRGEIEGRLARLQASDPGGDFSLGEPLPQVSPAKMQWKLASEGRWREALPGGVPSTPAGALEEMENLRANQDYWGTAMRERERAKAAAQMLLESTILPGR